MVGNMAFLNSATSILSKVICTGPSVTTYGFQQMRNYWTKAKTRRDMKRRKMAKDFAVDRLRLLGMKRNDILPKEIQELASKGFDDIPRQSALGQLTNRCVVTSRAYGVVQKWRISRFIFRHLVDYNKMSGVQRALW